jgi:hypothetical protein
MGTTNATQVDEHFRGVSLSSFLQLLEHERKNCTLRVASNGNSGSFYFSEGDLVDAEFEDKVGLDAVYALLSMDNPTFKVTRAEDRMIRIKQPLTGVLLDATSRIDEENFKKEKITMVNDPVGSANVQANPALKKLVATIVDVPGVKHYYLLNRQGKMITQSSRNQKICDFIAYSIVSGLQLRKSLEAKGPHRIKIVMEDGETLLIMPGGGMIIGLMLDEQASITDVTTIIRSTLRSQAGK